VKIIKIPNSCDIGNVDCILPNDQRKEYVQQTIFRTRVEAYRLCGENIGKALLLDKLLNELTDNTKLY